MKWSKNTSKKLLRVKVTSHESELEFDISPKSTGKYLFDLVCSTIGLRETWYFGLQNYVVLSNGKLKLLQWLKLDKKIVSQKSTTGQTQFCFFFHTKFFPEDIEQELIQATTKHLFYLSVKAKILNRTESSVNEGNDLCPTVDVAIILASLAAQADFGDVCEDDLDGKDGPLFLPNRLLRLIPKQLLSRFQCDQKLVLKLKDCYKSYKGISRDKAELQYLKLAQAHHLFGVDYFPIICVRMKCPRTLSLARYFVRNDISPFRTWNKRFTNAWLGVTAAGIQLYSRNQREKPRYTFQWNIIKNVSYRERKFTIKLVGSWRCYRKINAAPYSNLGNSFETPDSQRSRHVSRSASGRSPLLGPGPGINTGAASLPTTPLSVRLAPPTINSSAAEINTVTSSPLINRDFSGERSDCPRKLSPSLLKVTGRPFDTDSGCVSSLLPSSSRCSTGDTPVVASGACLTVTKFQTTDSSAAGSSASSRGSFPTTHCSFMDHMINVVEVWLADPSQAKTVMSMCAGNHALFMRRRQPDSVEVQQMRAQAREERARRELERTRLARARAEKAEAVEARLALESRCAQLEQALLRQQAALSPDSDSGASNREKVDDNGEEEEFPLTSDFYDAFEPQTSIYLNSKRHEKKVEEMQDTDWNAVKENPQCNLPKLPFRPQCNIQHFGRRNPDAIGSPRYVQDRNRFFGSASTPATPHAKRSIKLRPSIGLEHVIVPGNDSVLNLTKSIPCLECMNAAVCNLPCTCHTGNRFNTHYSHATLDPFARNMPLPHPYTPGSMPILYDDFETGYPNDLPVVGPNVGYWHPALQTRAPIRCTNRNPHVCPWFQFTGPQPHTCLKPKPAFVEEREIWDAQPMFPADNSASKLSTSLSAILSPVAGHRLRHLQSRPLWNTYNVSEKGFAHENFNPGIPEEPFGTAHFDEAGCILPRDSEWLGSGPAGLPTKYPCDAPYHIASVEKAAAQGILLNNPPNQWTAQPNDHDYPEYASNNYCANNYSNGRGYLSHCLQEERAKFAVLQEQFSKQLLDTWTCLCVTRSAAGSKQSTLPNPTISELRVDPAGASDGASPGGGAGACRTNGVNSVPFSNVGFAYPTDLRAIYVNSYGQSVPFDPNDASVLVPSEHPMHPGARCPNSIGSSSHGAEQLPHHQPWLATKYSEEI